MRTITLIMVLLLQSCSVPPSQKAPASHLYDHPELVNILGYNDDAMEPFITRDGKYLLFNNSNGAVNTNLHYAVRVDDLTFQYKGEIVNANSSALDGVPTMDKAGNLYFVSMRSYSETLSTIYHAKFVNGVVSNVALASGISLKKAGMLNFDVEVNHSGDALYFVDGRFSGSNIPDSADIVLAKKSGEKFVRSPQSDEIMKLINTNALEFAPCISADELTLLFTRLYKGKLPQIYISQRRSASEPFGNPAHLEGLGELVEAPTLSPNDNSLYYHQKVGKRYLIFKAKK
jgi:hypothetical protein